MIAYTSAAMKLGVPTETFPGERRVAIVPAVLPAAPPHRERHPGSQPRTRRDEIDEHAAKCRRACHEHEAARLILATLGRCCKVLG